MPVRLFIGNLPYNANEAELRAHLASVAPPSYVAMPVDRETGRPRGFAFVEFVDRETADLVIQRFNQQPFQGRNLAVNEARAREDRPPPRPGGFGSGSQGTGHSRPSGISGSGSGSGGRDRSANFGPPAPPKRLRNAKKSSQQEHRPRGPIKERTGGRIYDVEDLSEDESVNIDNVATRAPDATPVDIDNVATRAPDATPIDEADEANEANEAAEADEQD